MASKNIIRLTLISLATLLQVPASHAAAIAFMPADGQVEIGAGIDVKLVGRDFLDGTIGGGFSIAWDPALLSLTSWNTDGFRGDKFLAADNTTTTLDNAAGTLSNVSVLSFFSGEDGPDFEIASFSFVGLAVGVSNLHVTLGRFDSDQPNIWGDAGGIFNVDPTFVAGELTVSAVPVPAALPLLAGSISLLLGNLRRRHVAA